MGTDIEKLIAQVIKNIAEDENSVKTTGGQKKKIDFISLDDAKVLCEYVEQKAREMGVNAVVAVADNGGNLKICECMDDSYIASRDIAINKAFTSVSLKMSTKKLSVLAKPDGPLYGIQHTNNGKIVIFGGGDTLICSGKILGGLGVSGGSEEQDTELCAVGKKFFEEKFN